MIFLQLSFKYKFTLLFVLFHGFHSLSIAQTETEIKLTPFLILVESTDDGLKFKCDKGCAWTDLSFALNEDETQGVNQEGMTRGPDDKAFPHELLADFHFEVRKDSNGIYFKSLRGTAWLTLDFASSDGKHHYYFDEYGIRNID